MRLTIGYVCGGMVDRWAVEVGRRGNARSVGGDESAWVVVGRSGDSSSPFALNEGAPVRTSVHLRSGSFLKLPSKHFHPNSASEGRSAARNEKMTHLFSAMSLSSFVTTQVPALLLR